MRGVFQATIVDSGGAIVPDCSIEVRDEDSGDLVQLYDAFDGGNTLGNPFEADSEGFQRFYVESGVYRIRAYLGNFERIWRHVVIGVGAVTGTFDATLTGFAAPLTPTVSWKRTGHLVTLHVDAEVSGTSNAATMTLTGLPLFLRPIRDTVESCLVIENSGTKGGYAVINANDSVVTLHTARTETISDAIYPFGSFAASGTKGLPSSWTLTYSA